MPRRILAEPLSTREFTGLHLISLKQAECVSGSDLEKFASMGLIQRKLDVSISTLGVIRLALGREPDPRAIDAAEKLFRMATGRLPSKLDKAKLSEIDKLAHHSKACLKAG
jgi:hypothetical protein